MDIRLVDHKSPDYWQTIDLRLRVLRRPLGLDFSPEQLDAEASDLHLAAFDGDQIAGCLVLTPVDVEKIKMRQVAVDTAIQRGGLGTRMVVASEEVARELGFREMVLNARDTAVPFYLRLDYEVVGEPFEEVTIPHRKMRKSL